MNPTERALQFDCRGTTLLGILTQPEVPLATAVLIIVGGPQYRAGSHRQFVLLARALARGGYPVLRFDFRGTGDSGGTPRSFEAVDEDISCALSALERATPGVERFVLWGLCDGASAALLYIERTGDARVAGLCLVNPWVRSEASLARTQVKYYYTRRLMEREFWLKLARGQVGAGAMRRFAGSMGRALSRGSDTPAESAARAVPFQHRMAIAWKDFAGRILLLLSGDDYTAKEFLEFVAINPAWRGALTRAGVERKDLAHADHTFSNKLAREQAEALTVAWLRGTGPPAPPSAAPVRTV